MERKLCLVILTQSFFTILMVLVVSAFFLGLIGIACLAILIELVTVLGSVVITQNAAYDSILETINNGYKPNKRWLDEEKSKKNLQEKSRFDAINMLVAIQQNTISTKLLLVPGINLIYASIKGAKLKKDVMKNPELKKYLVPMFEEEKEMYEDSFNTKLSGKTIRRSKIEWLDWYISTQYGLVSLCYEKLMPLDYTLDEVKRLNEATTYSYRIGKMDGRNIAIIGIPNPNGTIKKIRSKEDNYNTIHMYENMTEEEAKNKTFTVYPFTIYEETQSEVEKAVQEIKKSRIDQAVKANLEEREASKVLQS